MVIKTQIQQGTHLKEGCAEGITQKRIESGFD